MTTHIATVFDKNYLVRAIALRNSLYKFCPDSNVWFLCLDEESYSLTQKLNLKNTKIVSLDEMNDSELMATKGSRTSVEFTMGSKASFLKYILDSKNIEQGDQLVFIDADILFYSSAQKTFEKAFRSGTITLTAHKYPKEKEYLSSILGYFNSGLIFFINDQNARECIEDWRKQCIEWCSVAKEEGKYTDQMYLNDWPKKYKIYELPDKGVNTGTWNIKRFKITKKNDYFFIDGDILVCYHAHGLKIYINKNNKISAYPITIFHSEIYKIYLDALNEAYAQILAVEPSWNYGFVKKPDIFRIIKQRVIRYFRDLKFT